MTIFAGELHKRLELDEHTQWAGDLSKAELGGLLWMTGELGARYRLLLELLARHTEMLSSPYPGLSQCRVALEGVSHKISTEAFATISANSGKPIFAETGSAKAQRAIFAISGKSNRSVRIGNYGSISTVVCVAYYARRVRRWVR